MLTQLTILYLFVKLAESIWLHVSMSIVSQTHSLFSKCPEDIDTKLWWNLWFSIYNNFFLVFLFTFLFHFFYFFSSLVSWRTLNSFNFFITILQTAWKNELNNNLHITRPPRSGFWTREIDFGFSRHRSPGRHYLQFFFHLPTPIFLHNVLLLNLRNHLCSNLKFAAIINVWFYFD